jgi:hypothetical protein
MSELPRPTVAKALHSLGFRPDTPADNARFALSGCDVLAGMLAKAVTFDALLSIDAAVPGLSLSEALESAETRPTVRAAEHLSGCIRHALDYLDCEEEGPES